MEGVGARLGRSSTRYGPATVFSGPVRKWKKKWVHVSPPSNASSSLSNHHHHHHHQSTANNGNVNANNGSHLLLYKWTPLTPSQNVNNGETKISAKDDGVAEEPPRRKFKYIPIALLEEQKNEAAEQIEDESQPIETDINTADPTSETDDFDEKPDINDVPMDENQAATDGPLPRQDLNESLDLSLGLKAHDDDGKTDQTKHGQLERVNSSHVGAAANRLGRANFSNSCM